MLFEFEFLNHNINRVGEIPLHFFEESLVRDRYSNQLYPRWFVPILDKLPAVKERFKTAYKEINKLKQTKFAELLLLADNLRSGYDISTLCNDTTLEGPRSEFISQ